MFQHSVESLRKKTITREHFFSPDLHTSTLFLNIDHFMKTPSIDMI